MIVRALKDFLVPPAARQAHTVYAQLVEQARKPVFYKEYGVADTLDGRFDVIVLHMFLLIHRLRHETSPGVGQFIRALSEVFFADMDRSLRELGVGDTGVGPRVKKMVSAFYGRLQSYEQSLEDDNRLQQSILRNLYRLEQGEAAGVVDVASYVRRNLAHLETQDAAAIMDGAVTFLS